MSVLGERFGARVDRVAVAHSLRLVVVVSTIPWIYKALGIHGADPFLQGSRDQVWSGVALLLAATAVGGVIFQRWKVPNAWTLGSLFVAAPLTALQVKLSVMPTELSNLAQLMLGCALGSRFEQEFVRSAPRFVFSVLVSTVIAIVLAAAFGYGLAELVGVHPATMILATAPGGMAEMSVTAKVLQLGVPIVTAFHVTRAVILLTLTAPIFAFVRRRRPRPAASRVELDAASED